MDERTVRELSTISLPHLTGDGRFHLLDKCDAYHSNTQYRHLKFDWNGNFDGYGDQADISPGWFVPIARRRPAVKVQMAKMIVNRFTSMLFGEERFPTFNVPGDNDAEDYVRGLIKVSKFEIKLAEARDKGGACGTAVMSFAFVEGKPRVSVHRAKHMKVLRWQDRYEFRPATVLKSFKYHKYELVEGKPKKVTYYYARLWTQDSETVWEPIPEERAKNGTWASVVPSYTVTHNYGDCPVYWAQNLPDSDSEDGISDFDNLFEEFDEINRLVSSTGKGTIANVDPTLVIHEDPVMNQGSIRKGSENAIYAKGGAKYLELTGTSIDTAMKLARELIEYACEVTGVVLPDPEKVSGAAKSAQALRIIFQPMTNQCDKLRAQYGDGLAVPMLQGMLQAARRVTGAGGEVYTTSDGRRLQDRPVIVLPPRVETITEYEKDPETGEEIGEPKERVIKTERNPGSSDNIELQWPNYFKPTQQDVAASVEAASKARGTLVSDKSATRYVSTHFGVTDIDAELEQMKREVEERSEMLPGPEEGLLFGGEEDKTKNKQEPSGKED